MIRFLAIIIVLAPLTEAFAQSNPLERRQHEANRRLMERQGALESEAAKRTASGSSSWDVLGEVIIGSYLMAWAAPGDGGVNAVIGETECGMKWGTVSSELDTGIEVEEGEQVIIQAYGNMLISAFLELESKPNGIGGLREFNLVGKCKHGSLIARVEDGPWSCIGGRGIMTSDRNGTIKVAVNDADSQNNSGVYYFEIQENMKADTCYADEFLSLNIDVHDNVEAQKDFSGVVTTEWAFPKKAVNMFSMPYNDECALISSEAPEHMRGYLGDRQGSWQKQSIGRYCYLSWSLPFADIMELFGIFNSPLWAGRRLKVVVFGGGIMIDAESKIIPNGLTEYGISFLSNRITEISIRMPGANNYMSATGTGAETLFNAEEGSIYWRLPRALDSTRNQRVGLWYQSIEKP